MDPTEALLSVRDLVEGDPKVYNSYYFEFQRRLLVLRLVRRYCPEGSLVLDLGASPFILSCALRRMGYRVIAYDYNPEQYMGITKACGIEVVKCDLERDSLNMYGAADCIVFTEVLEHLNPYYVGHTLTEMNKALRHGGRSILTTPNITSLSKRS